MATSPSSNFKTTDVCSNCCNGIGVGQDWSIADVRWSKDAPSFLILLKSRMKCAVNIFPEDPKFRSYKLCFPPELTVYNGQIFLAGREEGQLGIFNE